jgi:tetratricopeptide (TPR) repeat protein
VVAPRVVPAERRGPAAVQILAPGVARPVSQTLELGAAEDYDHQYDGNDFLADAPEGGLSVRFDEPEYGEEEEDSSAHVPELTDDEDAAPGASASLTEDGLVRTNQSALDAPLDEEKIRSFMEHARVAETKGDLRQAIVHYSDLLDVAPRNGQAHLGRGRSLMELGDYAAAMSDFQRSEDLFPDSPEPVVEMGNLYFARKEYRKAINYYDQVLELDPSHAMARCRRGICHHYRKNHQQAFQDQQKAYSLDPFIPKVRKYVQMAVKAMERSRK